ncbi:DUF3592 domain-containing protein [Nocardioides sp. WS12]|uniref:DUF3592 domain-containing protein n=1 Tax=Nocardioides sp. WS12 TaxID=2486272 RepID=UPI0015FC3BC7|nr:DUF3592 domain-containing protein [Nocardioides sp. WS12]
MSEPGPPPFTFEPRPFRPFWVVTAQLLLLVGGVAAGYGIGCTVIDGYGDGPASYIAGDEAGLATIGGGVAAVLGLLTWSLIVDQYPLQFGLWHALGTFGLASALGQLFAVVELDVEGRYVVAAIISGVVGAAALLVGGARVAARRKRFAHEVALIARGVPVDATVVDPGWEPDDFDEASNVITTSTFRYVGADGTSYVVRRRVTIPSRAPIEKGQHTTVWYDPDDPLNDKAIVVGIQHALRWNVPVPVPGRAARHG